MHHHRYNLSELENMMPWEREIYVSLLIDHVKKENEKLQILKQNAKNM
jgi:hypothetical protein